MDNFRRPQRSALRKGSAVDGFIRTPASSSGKTVRRTDIQAPRPTIGNFRQTEGFKPAAQPTVPSANFRSSSALNQTAQLDTRRGSKAIPKDGVKKRSWRHPFRRRAEDKPRNKWVTLTKRTAIALCALLLIGGGYIGAQAYLKSRKVLRGGGSAAALQANVSPSLLNGEGDGRVNILLLGRGGDGHDGPDLTDTIVLASVDPVHHEILTDKDAYVNPC